MPKLKRKKNGSIVDALNLFVSNAKGYFANLKDCAICYGVLALDRTLPTMVCPNGHWFHAVCLLKVSKPIIVMLTELVVQKFSWLDLSHM